MCKYLSAPIKVSFDITHRCNLRCKHCRISESGSSTQELTCSEVKQLINELSEMKVFVVGISGGEPLFRTDFVDIATYAASSNIGRVIVSTNCTLINEDILKKLYGYQNKFIFRVSIDGIDRIHDEIRGTAGAFKQTVDGIKLLVDCRFRTQVTTTVMKSNLLYVTEIIEFVKTLGVEKHRFVDMLPLGKGDVDLALSDEDRRLLWLNFEQNKQTHQANTQIELEIPFTRQSMRDFTCRGGKSECGVLPDGTVVGCRLLPGIVCGNIRERRFSDIWNDAEAFEYFRELTVDKIKGNCLHCEYRSSCKGGCRAYAVAVQGDFYAPDSRCALVC